jgi:hypothetical protein
LGGFGIVEGLAHLGIIAVEFSSVSLEEGPALIQLFFELLEIISRHGGGAGKRRWAVERGRGFRILGF